MHWYVIEQILGQGGFGITYLAKDTNLGQRVAIKEFLPVELAMRERDASIHPVSSEKGDEFEWGLERFMSEAKTLARFKHPNIVRVLTVFQENNSAYMVMEYEQGKGLHEILKQCKTLPEQELLKIILPILDGLAAVHASNFIHRDIKPANIYIRDDASPVLLDFGSARQSIGERTHTLTTMVSPGYAPFEQYVSKSNKQGPWTDIYGLSATLYRAVTGISPVESMSRSEAILHTGKDVFVPAMDIARNNYSESLLRAIDHGLAFKPEDRPQNINDWQTELGVTVTTDVQVVTEKVTVIPGQAGDAMTILADQKTVKADGPEVQEGKHPLIRRILDHSNEYISKSIKWGVIALIAIIILGGIIQVMKKENTKEQMLSGESISSQDQMTGDVDPLPNVSDQDNIEKLLSGAEEDVQQHRLTSPAGNNAVEKYNEVLKLDPGNQDALSGLVRVVDEYIRLMDKAISSEQIADAENYLEKGISVDPLHAGIPAARERLNAAKTVASEPKSGVYDVIEDRATVESKPTKETVTSRIPESERESLRKIYERMQKNPNDKKARKELQKYSRRMEDKIKRAIADQDYDLAEDYLNEVMTYASEDSKRRDELQKIIDNLKSR